MGEELLDVGQGGVDQSGPGEGGGGAAAAGLAPGEVDPVLLAVARAVLGVQHHVEQAALAAGVDLGHACRSGSPSRCPSPCSTPSAISRGGSPPCSTSCAWRSPRRGRWPARRPEPALARRPEPAENEALRLTTTAAVLSERRRGQVEEGVLRHGWRR